MKKVLGILIGLVLVSGFAGTLYYLWSKSETPPVIFSTKTPKRADIVKKTVATGSVVPRKEVAIKPQVSGIVERLHVEPGQRVRRGDLVATIRIIPDMVRLADAESRVKRAEIALDDAQREHTRNQKLFTDGVVPETELRRRKVVLDQAGEELDAAREAVELIRKGASERMGQTSNTLVRATIDGTVLEVPAEEGNSVIEANTFNDGTTIATIADMSQLIFKGRVDESEVGKIRPGMTLLLTIGALENEPFEATLEHIAPKGIEKDGAIQFEIRAALKAREGVDVRANLSANADIVLDRRDQVLALDESLLQFEDGKAYVEVETAPQKFEKRPVETGLSDGIVIEVVKGVGEKDRIKDVNAPRPEATKGA
jgi:HlyD family secretion protein